MKIKNISIAVLFLSNSALGFEICPNEQAREDGGYLKSIEVCDYETVETNLRTSCHYSGKLWGALGGVIFQDNTIEVGHNLCAGSTYLSQTICGELTPPTIPMPPGPHQPPQMPNYPQMPTDPYDPTDPLEPPELPEPPTEPPAPIEPSQPEQVCDYYSGDVPLVSQIYSSDTVSQKILGSCHISREWVRCKP
jgi:hypothetical protein